jgi:ribonuclease G
VLPGESLTKYGGTSAEDEPKARPAAPARPSGTARPSTMVVAPFSWDGSGLMPGESIARHSNRAPRPEVEAGEERAEAFAAESAPRAVAALGLDEVLDELAVEEEELTREALLPEVETESDLTEMEESETEEMVLDAGGDEPEDDASASHHVDPLPPSTFRLFGMGGGKKKKEKDEQPDEQPEVAAPRPAATAAVSSFSPGNGFVEEEVIEGEESDVPLHRHTHKHDEGDLDEYEEETLQTQIRSGALGEMLQEAHLDHRIQLDFDDKNGEEDDEGEEEDAAAEGKPAGEGQTQQRRERGGRGRRGRGGERSGGERGAVQTDHTSERSGGRPDARRPSRRSAQTSNLPIISDLLKPGQEILVQIAKEPIAKKGARITSHIALPGRFLVFMPTVTHVGVSRKIASDEERQRLKRILVHERGEATGGFIVRTAAEGASEDELRADLRFLIHLWTEIKQRSDDSKSPALIYHDLSLIERILRDQVSANFSSIWVDSQEDYERIVRFLNRFSPTLVRRVKLYTKETPLFEHFGIQDEISKALRSKVWLKSGGSIVINQTEALVAIDINTGKYVGKSARLEDTIVKTNLDAVPEIVRQIRLRDLGGIIIIDFIDMDERKNRYKVMAALEEALKNDRAPTKVLQFNDFGLVAITRKRVKQSLERTLSVPCPVCQATGMVKSSATVCNEIFIELRKMRKHFENPDVLVRVNPETVKTLKANNARWLVDFEELTGKNILVKSDATLHPEQFDIQG